MTQQQTPEELRAEIERTRRDLGDTVDALSHKADVKEQARLKKEELQQQARVKKDEVQHRVSANPVPFAAIIGGGIAVLVLLRLIRRR